MLAQAYRTHVRTRSSIVAADPSMRNQRSRNEQSALRKALAEYRPRLARSSAAWLTSTASIENCAGARPASRSAMATDDGSSPDAHGAQRMRTGLRPGRAAIVKAKSATKLNTCRSRKNQLSATITCSTSLSRSAGSARTAAT